MVYDHIRAVVLPASAYQCPAARMGASPPFKGLGDTACGIDPDAADFREILPVLHQQGRDFQGPENRLLQCRPFRAAARSNVLIQKGMRRLHNGFPARRGR